MRKRILCMLLAACMLLSLVPVLALQTNAALNLTTSEEAIEILKKLEGFIEKPIYDNGQYTVGYGSGCGKDDYPNGITEEEADALLRAYLEEMEVTVNSFAGRYDIVFSQNQFDALMLFTYNCGGNWVHSDGILREAIIEGKSGNSFIFAMSLWSSASAKLSKGLVERRLAEANMYLNGKYSEKKPSNYTYVVYDLNEGIGDVKVQGFDCNLYACVQAEPTRADHSFLGWYTALEGGSWVTELSAANAEQTLYAHWQEGSGDAKNGTAANYQVPAGDLESLNTYDAPGGKVTGTLTQSAVAYIIGDYVDAKGVKWGKMRTGWVRLGDPRTGTSKENAAEDEISGVEVTVTGDFVNVRSGPGTSYKVVSMVVRGDKIVITQTGMVGDKLWGKFRAGWICLEYTDYSGGVTPDVTIPTEPQPEPEDEKVIATGVVIADRLNIRSAAGTHGYQMGCYMRGDRVSILEKAVNNGTPWGRTDKGWICLTYVKLDGAEEETTAPTTQPTTEPEETTKPEETTEPEETTKPDETTKPEETTEPEEDEDPVEGIYGTVTSKSGLNIRKAPGTNQPSVGGYPPNTRIKIYEQTLADGVIWGRTDRGWVCMSYVKLDVSVGGSVLSDVKAVVNANTLCIRRGPGTGYAQLGTYQKGDIVPILEITQNGGTKWGMTDKGWICMDYVTLQESSDDTPEPTTEPTTKPEPDKDPAPDTGKTTGIVTANGGLNIRKTPSTNAAVVGGYKKGDKIVILEQKLVGGTVWGRTDKGWICMNYVKLDTTDKGVSTAGYTGTVTASTLCIRKGPGTGNLIVGSYQRGQIITILETTKVGNTTWGRTELGWVCMDYVK